MVELGKIEKPQVEEFSGKRKLYCVSNVYPIEDAPEEYTKLFDTYWAEVAQQIGRLETIGKIKKIFCENIYVQGKEALEVLEKINDKMHQIVKVKIEEGAVILPIETEEIFGSYIDWSNCLRVVKTKEVFDKIFGFYTEFFNKRIDNILDVIVNNLSVDEAGLLIIRDEVRVRLQFPKDIEIFLVTPPSYDSIVKWIRDKWMKIYQNKDTVNDHDKESGKNS